jgi:hypothetical protein
MLIYFDLIPINLFKKVIPPNLTYPLASNEVAKKLSLANNIPLLSTSLEDTSTEKKALVGGKKNNFIKKLNKILSQ